MKKLLYLVILFLSCRLMWIWFQQCGTILGMGETLPFCIDCEPFATLVRLILLGIVIWYISKPLHEPVAETVLVDQDITPVEILSIHWHRIFVLLALLSYPIWIDWLDSNMKLPSPWDIFLISASCEYDGLKGTFLWTIEMLFVAVGFRILHKTEES